MSLRTSSLLAAAAVVVALAGCGGGEEPRPAKADYLRRANAICRVANAKVVTGAKQAFGDAAPTLAQIRAYADTTFFPVIERELRDLRALRAPEGDDARTAEIFDAVEAGLRRARTDPAQLGVPGASGPFARANARADAYGLTVCGAA